jgi:hypothetical protein
MPIHEIEERFCKSDLAIVGWRSQETSYLMDKKMKRGSDSAGPPAEASRYYNDPSLPTGMPAKFFNESGELDLRGVTGADALKFLRGQGVNVPFVPSRVHTENEED